MDLLFQYSKAFHFGEAIGGISYPPAEAPKWWMSARGVERRGLGRLAELLHIVTTSRFESFFEIIRYGMSREEAAEYNKLLSLYYRTGFEKVFFSGNVTGIRLGAKHQSFS